MHNVKSVTLEQFPIHARALIDEYLDRDDITGTVHLAILNEPYISLIIKGIKSIESRFTKNMIPPYNRAFKGDVVFMKKSGGYVRALFVIKKAMFFRTREMGKNIRKYIEDNYGEAICIQDEAYWKKIEGSNYCSLLEAEDVTCFPPFKVIKKDQRAWIIWTLTRKEATLDKFIRNS